MMKNLAMLSGVTFPCDTESSDEHPESESGLRLPVQDDFRVTWKSAAGVPLVLAQLTSRGDKKDAPLSECAQRNLVKKQSFTRCRMCPGGSRYPSPPTFPVRKPIPGAEFPSAARFLSRYHRGTICRLRIPSHHPGCRSP